MSKLRTTIVSLLIAAVAAVGLADCGGKNEQEQPQGEHPSSEHPSSEHPSGEHPN